MIHTSFNLLLIFFKYFKWNKFIEETSLNNESFQLRVEKNVTWKKYKNLVRVLHLNVRN